VSVGQPRPVEIQGAPGGSPYNVQPPQVNQTQVTINVQSGQPAPSNGGNGGLSNREIAIIVGVIVIIIIIIVILIIFLIFR
jgi:subtilase family serine protease